MPLRGTIDNKIVFMFYVFFVFFVVMSSVVIHRHNHAISLGAAALRQHRVTGTPINLFSRGFAPVSRYATPKLGCLPLLASSKQAIAKQSRNFIVGSCCAVARFA